MENSTKSFAIVGGGGYIGFHIGFELWERGHSVTLFDISKPDPTWWSNANPKSFSESYSSFNFKDYVAVGSSDEHFIKFVRGNILDLESLKKAFTHVDCVIHCASYGMSGYEQMPTEWTKTEQINVTGTENVLKACLACGVSGLIYTSSFNVIFGGQEIINGDESLPYFPLHEHVDHYSRTKAIAERLVLLSNGIYGESKNRLSTCSLRLAGVFGLGEKRHLPRIVDLFGLVLFTFGYGESLQQFCTLPNVVQAHVKAAEKILSSPSLLGGQPYFISDVVPLNTFEFMRPLREKLGYSQPKWKLPMWIIWLFVYITQAFHVLFYKIHPSLAFTPLLTPAEVYKAGVTHYFSSEKAKRDFGYLPKKPNDISDVIEFYYKRKVEMCKRDNFTFQVFKPISIIIVFIVVLYCLF